jgi:molybdopterin-guanine dinucleotide biosynthesis protein A
VRPSSPLGAVLAGGAGTRLGGAKATADLAGRPLISYTLAALAAAGIEALVVAKAETELPVQITESGASGPPPIRVLREPELPTHPLCGIVAALREAGERPLVVLACDMPFAAPALLAELGAAPEPLVVPAPGGLPQPLQARYSAELLPALEDALDREEPLRRTVASLSPRLLDDAELVRFGDLERLFLNVNDALDLRRTEGMLGP